MKLFYYKAKKGNFGDDLNTLVWPQLIGDLLNKKHNNIIIIGMGTILDDRLPKDKKKIILGSGVRLACKPPVVDSTWDIRALRGPLSAMALNVSKNYAVTDPGILVKKFFKSSSGNRDRISFMCHFRTPLKGAWEFIAKELDFNIINPTSSVKECINIISRSKLVITESLHGAIVADALRVPWIRVKMHVQHKETNSVNDFKWMDWMASMDIKPNSYTLPRFWPETRGLKRYIKLKIIKNKLKKIAREENACLSRDDVLKQKLEQWDYVINKLLLEWKNK